MTRPTLLSLPAAHLAAFRATCAGLAALDDADLGTRLLANTPTHESRDRALLRTWATAATSFGTELALRDAEFVTAGAPSAYGPSGAAVAAAPPGPGVPRVVEREGGIERSLFARYVSRPVPVVELYADTLMLGEEVVEALGWREWFPRGTLREAVLAHEDAHHALHHDKALRRALRERVGHTALRIGRRRVTGHVVGADELAAHGYAAARCGLGRTPLLLTAALASAVRALDARALEED
ncbi:hypothetical protein ACWGJ2_20320 [Streptomyces sp. NPDC054796]